MISGGDNYVSIMAVDFEPPANPVKVLGDAFYMAPLTPSNYARLSVTPDCTIPPSEPPFEPSCYQVAREGTDDGASTPMNQRALTFSFTSHDAIREELVGFEYRGPMFEVSTDPGDGISWTLTEPLRILLPGV